MLRIGAHMSVAGGVSKAVDRAVVHGCEALQIFTRNANRWQSPPLDPAEVRRFRAAPRGDAHRTGRVARQLSDQPRDHRAGAQRSVHRRVPGRARSRERARSAWRGVSSGYLHERQRRRCAALDRDGDRNGVQAPAAPADDGIARAHRRTGTNGRSPLRTPGRDHRAPRWVASHRGLSRHLSPDRVGLRHRVRGGLRGDVRRIRADRRVRSAARSSTATIPGSRGRAASIGTSTSAADISAWIRSGA